MAFQSADLDISLYFDLTNTQFRVKDNSPYVAATPSIPLTDVVGVYKCTDPNSNILHENIDFNSPDIDLDGSLYSGYISFTVADGVYTVVYSVYDSNTTTTYSKTFTFTYAASNTPTVVIDVESDVGLATISSTDETAFTAAKVLNTRTHTLTYPASWGSTVSTSITVDSISLTDLYTGEYTSTITSTLTITQTDNLIIDATITGTETHDVWDTDGFYTVREALNSYYDSWQTNKTANPSEGRNQEYVWTEICANYTMYNSYKQNGDIENAGEYLDNIKALLAAEDIDTDVDPSTSVPVSSVIPGYASQWLSGSGVPAASLGRTVDFYVNTDTNIYYTKATGSWVAAGSFGGYTFNIVSGTIAVPTDSSGNNQVYTNAATDIIIYKDSTDDTTNWAFAKGSVSNADGTVASNTLTLTNLTADTGYVEVTCTKSGATTLTVRVYAKKIKAGASGASGSEDQIPFMNAVGDDFEYSANFTWDGTTLYLEEGTNNIFIGNLAGSSKTTGQSNTILGIDAGEDLTSGNSNTIIGAGAGSNTTNAVSNTFIGSGSGSSHTTGSSNTIIGTDAGSSLTSGARNVLIGIQAGGNETGSDKLYIENSNSATPLIYGEFDNDLVRVNGDLDVTGDITGGGIITVANNHVISDVGNAFTDSKVEDSGYVNVLNSTQIVTVADITQGLTTYTFDGTDWTKTGNSTAAPPQDGIKICDLDGYYIAQYNPVGTPVLQTYLFDGTDWNTQGNALSVTNSSLGHKLAKIGHYKICMYHPDDGANGGLRTYTWDGTDWTKTGNTLNLAANFTTLASFGEDSVVVSNVTGGTIQKYDWDGTDWAAQGNSLSISGMNSPFSVVQLNATDIAVRVDTDIEQYRYDGYSWYLLKTTTKTSGVFCALKDGKTVSIDSVNGIQTLARINLY